MLKIAVVNLKGGVGKSTLSVHLADAFHGEGKRVVLIDADPQGSCLEWSARITDAPNGNVVVMQMEHVALSRDLPKLDASFDVAVVDTPGRLGKAARAAMIAADIVLIPCTPGPMDVWATAETIEAVQEALSLKPSLQVSLVPNRCDRTSNSRKAMQAFAELELPVLDASMGSRVAFAEAAGEGKGILEYAPASDAAREMRRVLRAVNSMAVAS